MKRLRTTLASVLLLVAMVSADPAQYTESVDDLGWPIWQSESLPGQIFYAPGALMIELGKQESASWFVDQAITFSSSRQLQAETARRLESEGRYRESSKFWWRVDDTPDTALHLEVARHFYANSQWDKALESLSHAGPFGTHLIPSILEKEPTLSRVVDSWTVLPGEPVLLKDEQELALGRFEPGDWNAISLGQVRSEIDRKAGRLHLPHINLQLQIQPASAVDQLANELAGRQGVKEKLGESVKGKDIDVYYFGHGPEKVVFFGAFHGDEPESAKLMFQFVAHLQSHPELLEGRTAVIVPVVNPDGLSEENRRNANEVDLNRNYPTSNWNSEGEGTDYWGGKAPASEPETKIVVDLLERIQPARIISVHAPYKCVNFDGPAQKLAELLSQENGYKVEPSIGYPTPGSFGTYAGIEKKIPTITLELPPQDTEDVWKDNRRALVKALRGHEGWPALHEAPISSD